MNISAPFIARPVATTLLTLFTTPVIYLGFEALARRWRGRAGGPSAGPSPAGPDPLGGSSGVPAGRGAP